MKILKKITVFMLCFLTAINIFPVVSAAQAKKYTVTADCADLYMSPDANSPKTGEVYKGTFIYISEINGDFGRTHLAASDIWGWVELSDLKEVNETESGIKGIEVTPPVKTVYTDGDKAFDKTGLKVFAIKKDGTKTEVSGFSIYVPELKGPGEKTVAVTYTPDGSAETFTASFKITVKRLPIKKLELVCAPAKTEYIENQPLDLSGLSVKIIYENEKDNRTVNLEEILSDPGFTVDGICRNGEKIKEGRHIFTVTYKYSDIKCSFEINARKRKLTGLTLIKGPDETTVYSDKEIPAIDGLQLEAEYDNGEKEIKYHYHCKVKCNPEDFIVGPGNKVDVYFEDMKVTVEFRYLIPQEEGIELDYTKVPAFRFGDKIDISDLRVYLRYTDGTIKEIHDYTVSEINPSLIGKQNIIVRYKDFTNVFSIIITKNFGTGDVDGDGKITANDARQALRGSVNLVELKGLTFSAADADKDGKITANDARLILRASVKLEELV